MYPHLKQTIKSVQSSTLSNERKEVLKPLIEYLSGKVKSDESARIVFVCTHNSRRSHLAQIWMQALAHYYGFHKLYCYSAELKKQRYILRS